MADSTSPKQASFKDIMDLVEGLKASGLSQLLGQDLLSFGDPMKRLKALQNIPTPAARGVSAGELGMAPQGLIFTGGSPHELDFTGRRIQNTIFALSQLLGALEQQRGSKGGGLESIMAGLRGEVANRG